MKYFVILVILSFGEALGSSQHLNSSLNSPPMGTLVRATHEMMTKFYQSKGSVFHIVKSIKESSKLACDDFINDLLKSCQKLKLTVRIEDFIKIKLAAKIDKNG